MSTTERLELLTLKQVFAEGTRSFKIPPYQRGYSWESEQRRDLLNDIEYGINGSYTHYTGTLVAVKSSDLNHETFEIVDGQQRLTTLIILLTSIAHTFKRIDITAPKGLWGCFIEEGSSGGSTLRKFRLSDEQDRLFWQLVQTGLTGLETPKTKGDKNLVEAFKEFKEWCYKHKANLPNIYEYITSKLGFLLYAPDNTKEIGIMFEVINSRGKPLSELEKVKNYLIYYSEKKEIPDLAEVVKRSWQNILEYLNSCSHTSNEEENGFLRNCWIVFQDTNKSKSFYVYDNLKDQFPIVNNNWMQLKEFVEFLEKAALTYQKLYTRENIIQEEKECLTRLGYQPALASVLPLILAIYARDIKISNRTILLQLIEKLNFRFYGTGIATRADSRQGELFKLAYDFYNYYSNTHEDGLQINEAWLQEKLRIFVAENANDQQLIKYLTLDKDETRDYFNWQWLKYFLANYEGYVERKNNRSEELGEKLAVRDSDNPNDFYHREHIWAVNDFTKINDKVNRDVNKRRIGNFILLRETQNIKISNKPPEVKVVEYLKDVEDTPNTYMIRELKGLFDQANEEINKKRTNKTRKYWYEVYARFFDLHEEKYLDFALERWRIEGVTDKPVKKVNLNSQSDNNQIYELKYE